VSSPATARCLAHRLVSSTRITQSIVACPVQRIEPVQGVVELPTLLAVEVSDAVGVDGVQRLPDTDDV
jgi:hypothetical protein